MTAEQQARDILERMGVEDAQSWSAGELVELANLIADRSADGRVLWGIVANARRVASRRHQRSPLWAVVSDATGIGSTHAGELCRRFGFDPDSTKRETDKLGRPK